MEESNWNYRARGSSLRIRRNAHSSSNTDKAQQHTKRPKSSGEIHTDFLEETGKRRSLPKFGTDSSYHSTNHLSACTKEDEQYKTNTIDGYYKKGLEITEKITVGQPRGNTHSPFSKTETNKKSIFESIKNVFWKSPNSEKLKKLEEDYKKRLKEHEETIRNIKIKCEQREEAFIQSLRNKSGIPFNTDNNHDRGNCWVEEVD